MIVVDSSAMLAILLDEFDADLYAAALRSDAPINISAVNLHECFVVLLGRRGMESWASLQALLADG